MVEWRGGNCSFNARLIFKRTETTTLILGQGEPVKKAKSQLLLAGKWVISSCWTKFTSLTPKCLESEENKGKSLCPFMGKAAAFNEFIGLHAGGAQIPGTIFGAIRRPF